MRTLNFSYKSSYFQPGVKVVNLDFYRRYTMIEDDNELPLSSPHKTVFKLVKGSLNYFQFIWSAYLFPHSDCSEMIWFLDEVPSIDTLLLVELVTEN